MKSRLKFRPVADQVMVITGATSGIGLSTARAAAARGARLVLAARNEPALKAVRDDLASKGATVVYCVADVGDEAQVRAIAERALEAFGRFDVWVNNAGVSILGALLETSAADQRRLFDTNYWGVVYGSAAAIDQFRHQEGGGVLINVGSTLGDLPTPMQGPAAASKAAVAAFTRTLRMELAAERAPVSVTLIKPSAIDTPYRDHERKLAGGAAPSQAPVYATPLVADAILYAATHRIRELTVGSASGVFAALSTFAPGAAEGLLASAARRSRTAEPAEGAPDDNLHHAGHDLRERSFRAGVREHSLYSTAQMKPRATFGLAVIAVLAAVAALLGFRIGGRKGGA